MDWPVPRCAAVDPGYGLRCQQVPDHGNNAHAAVWQRPRGPAQLRRWRDGENATDTGVDAHGDLVSAGEVSWALGFPAHEVVE